MSQALAQSNSYTEDDYYNLPEHIRAELIDGQFYNMSAPNRMHQEILGFLFRKIGNYIASKNVTCRIYPAPFAVKLFEDAKTIVEPDISVICDPNKLTNRGCTGAPDWIIEIVSPSNPAHDYVEKLSLYKRAGVQEYWIVDPRRERIFVYDLKQETFELEMYTFHSRVKANICDELWIDFKELNL